MSERPEKDSDTLRSLLASPFIKDMIRHMISRRVKPGENNKYYQAILSMGDNISTLSQLKEVMFYLEHAKWSVAEARMQRELDQIDRAGPERDDNGDEIDNVNANPKLDRGLARVGNDYDLDLCEIGITVGNDTQTFTYPKVDTINSNDQKDVDDLNRWRHHIIRHHVGLPKYERTGGISFHQLQVDYLLNRYAAQEVDERGRCGYDEIKKDHNNVFQGVFLPGRSTACVARSTDSIISLLTRKAINPREKKRAWPKHYNGVMRHAAAQARIRKEWNARKK